MTKTSDKLDQIIAAMSAQTSVITNLAERLTVLENGSQTPASKPQKETQKNVTNSKSGASDEKTVTGTVSYVAVQGNGAQLDGPKGQKETGRPWYNAKKGKTPFANLLGKRVQLTYVVLTDDSGRKVNRVLGVELFKGKASAQTSAPETEDDDTSNISGLAMRAAVPSSSGKSCPCCSGPLHGKGRKEEIIDACIVAQYVNAGNTYRPHVAADRMAVALWQDATDLIVAVTYDGSKKARITAKNELSAPTAKTAQEEPVKRGPGRPRKDTSTTGEQHTTTVRKPARQQTTEEKTGTLLKISEKTGKIQFQVKGERFAWLLLAAGVKVKESWIGKRVVVQIDANNTAVSVERAAKTGSAPKA